MAQINGTRMEGGSGITTEDIKRVLKTPLRLPAVRLVPSRLQRSSLIHPSV